MIYFRKGDLLESECDYICHQVNCQGKMNSGIAKSIREKWPIVFQNYIAKCEAAEKSAVELYGCYEMAPCGSDLLLGNIQFVPLWTDFEKDIKHQSVVNLFAQQYYGYDGKRYTSYDAFWNCLNLMKQSIKKGSTIGFPKKIGCVRGGANWAVILEMITEVLGGDYTVYIFDLEGEKSVY